MRNLAGTPEAEANEVVTKELEAAGVPVVNIQPDGEVRASVGGMLEVGAYAFSFRRLWVYWSVRALRAPSDTFPVLPASIARALNDAPGTGEATYYGGRGRNLSAVVRADGFAGGLRSLEIDGHGVSCWHVDTQEGLTRFVQWLRDNLSSVA
jgi:hypothetical protein